MPDSAPLASPLALPVPPQPPAKAKRSGRVTPRLKRALDAMVWDCLTDSQAAVANGLTVMAVRIALRHPEGRAYYRGQLDVLRQRESSRNIHALIDVRDQTSNQNARVSAVKALEQLDDVQAIGSAIQRAPGLTIVINTGAPAERVIDKQSTVIDA